VINKLKQDLSDAHARLRASAHNTAIEITKDIRVMRSHEGDPSDIVERYLYRGSWVELVSGLNIMLIDDSSSGTRALVEGSGSLPEHYHTFSETLNVLTGEAVDVASGRVYYSGMTITHAPNEVHCTEIRGLVMVTWHPPLPLIATETSMAEPLVLHLTNKA